jgi:hypothetical protein
VRNLFRRISPEMARALRMHLTRKTLDARDMIKDAASFVINVLTVKPRH